MSLPSKDSFGIKSVLKTAAGDVDYFRLAGLEEQGLGAISKLPNSVKVVLESVARGENGREIVQDDVAAFAKYDPTSPQKNNVPYMPARVLMQDFTGVPAVVDLAALRSAMARQGKNPEKINPLLPVDLVIDHSVQVDQFGTRMALAYNTEREFERNAERYAFLRWGQKAFKNFRVIPPESGICHQVNLEYLASVVQLRDGVAYPDSCVGTDSHTTMIGGLGILGWGVGGIEAEAVMLGQPYFMLEPEVVGFKMTGELPVGVTATDLVLVVTELLRKKGVVDKFVEFYGHGLSKVPLADRATIANMAPEYGARCGFFPVDHQTLEYLRHTGRPDDVVDRVERYAKEQGMFRTDDSADPVFLDTVELDLSTVEPSLAGPKRPQDRVSLSKMKSTWESTLRAPIKERGFALPEDQTKKSAKVDDPDGKIDELRQGDVVIAAITSCTNTSNPYVMIGAGLVAKKAVEKGLTVAPYVKTSLAPGSTVVTKYLEKSGLTPFLDQLGFQTVGYGCTTCIGNSGPLADSLGKTITDNDLVVASVLSGNRNFEGRVHQQVKANYLASPMLVVAYALAGTVDLDLTTEPIGKDKDGNPVMLAEIWPSREEIVELLRYANDPAVFREGYTGIEESNRTWNDIPVAEGATYDWQDESTYIQEPPFFEDLPEEPPAVESIKGARVLVKVGDSTTTDHISPAGSIIADGPAGKYLIEHGVEKADFNSFGSRRGNDRVMTRGTFANVRIRNQIAPGTEGGFAKHFPTGEVVSIFEAAERYKKDGTPTIVLAGKDYGMGSSRDWAAKGTNLLGVKAVIAESYETIHRSNLVGMGVMPLVFKAGENSESLGLTGSEVFTVELPDDLTPSQEIKVTATKDDGSTVEFTTVSRLDSKMDVEYYRHGGILQRVLRDFLKGAA